MAKSLDSILHLLQEAAGEGDAAQREFEEALIASASVLRKKLQEGATAEEFVQARDALGVEVEGIVGNDTLPGFSFPSAAEMRRHLTERDARIAYGEPTSEPIVPSPDPVAPDSQLPEGAAAVPDVTLITPDKLAEYRDDHPDEDVMLERLWGQQRARHTLSNWGLGRDNGEAVSVG